MEFLAGKLGEKYANSKELIVFLVMGLGVQERGLKCGEMSHSHRFVSLLLIEAR